MPSIINIIPSTLGFLRSSGSCYHMSCSFTDYIVSNTHVERLPSCNSKIIYMVVQFYNKMKWFFANKYNIIFMLNIIKRYTLIGLFHFLKYVREEK